MIKTLLRSLLVIFILGIALAAFILTPSGLRMSVDLASHFLPGELSYQKISGVIIGPMTIDHLQYKNKDETMSADQVRIDWRPMDIFKKELHISSLDIQNLHVISHNKTIPAQWTEKSIQRAIYDLRETIKDQILPLHLELNEMNVTQLTVSDYAQQTQLKKISFQDTSTKNQLNIKLFATIDKPSLLNIQFQLHENPSGDTLHLLITGDHTDWDLVGTGNQQSWHFHTLKDVFLNGTLNAELHLNLKSTLNWRAKLTAVKIDLSRLDPLLTSSLTGQLNSTDSTNDLRIQTATSHFHFTAMHKNAWHIHGNFLSSNGELKHAEINLIGNSHDNVWRSTLNQLTLHFNKIGTWRLVAPTFVTATEHTINVADLCVTSKRAGNVCLQQGALENQQLSGNLQINITHFAWARTWSHLFEPSGQIQADLALSGTTRKPIVNGSIHLAHGSFIFPTLHITLHDITASITSNAEKLNFNAQAFSQNQPINLKGSVDLTQPDFLATVSLTSNNALIIDTDQYIAYATADLKATVKDKDVFLTGTIIVPVGSMTAHDFQSTTTLPDDDIVYTAGVAHPPKPFWLLHTNVTVTLQKIQLNAFHANAQLYGTMQLMQEPNHDMFANGSINVRRGTYTVYGQTLTLSPTSSLDFPNSLLNDPVFHVNATKVIRSVNLTTTDTSERKLIVGVEIHGRARALKITFFSNRGNLSQSDILSYLLLGYGGTADTPGNTDILLRALAAVNMSSQGLMGKQNIAMQIQQGLGLREMGVESETTTEANGNPLNRQSAFVVGKNIAHNFYVRYSIGLLAPVDVIELRYLFNKNWSVQTDSSSLGNGADVFYTLERD